MSGDIIESYLYFARLNTKIVNIESKYGTNIFVLKADKTSVFNVPFLIALISYFLIRFLVVY